jgi:hypothetical protein
MAKKAAQELPQFVVEGEFEDHEWREIAATKEEERTPAQKRHLASQPHPRLHPYGQNAYRDEAADGTVRWFADRDARDRYVNQNEAAAEGNRSSPSPTEAGPRQAAAQKKGLASEERVQGREGKGHS